MPKFPHLAYELATNAYLAKLIHLIPEGVDKPKDGISITCHVPPFDSDGMIDPELRSIIQRIGAIEQKRSGMRVWVIYDQNDCDIIQPDGSALRSSEPLRLTPHQSRNDSHITFENGSKTARDPNLLYLKRRPGFIN